MAQIIQFTPRKELSAQHNLQNLIRLSRDHLVTWSDLPGFAWENSCWPTTARGIRFTNHENRSLHSANSPVQHQLMSIGFTEFTKAYIRYRHTINPHRNIAREMQALRALEIVLRQDMGVPDITKVNQRHFDQAVAELDVYKAQAFIVGELLNILKMLADFFIVTSNSHYWKNPYIGKKSYEFANGAKADSDTKDAKLPDQDALLAIAEVFGRGNTEKLDDVDTMVTSITCLLLSAPMRIGETIRLRTDCITHDTDKEGETQYYIRYWVPKTEQFARKPIPATMASNALEAVERLKRITDDSRQLARYMENSPTTFYRHGDCPNVADDEELSRNQVAQALGFANHKSSEDFILRHTGRRSLTGFTLNSLWQIVLVEHHNSNPHFPYQQAADVEANLPLKMSDSLLCFLRLQLSIRNASSPVLLAPFNKDYFGKRLSASVKKERNNQRPMCFFTRHGFKVIQLKSHSLRHLLNRLARRSGVSVDTITAWSSRASSKQTLAYLNDDPQDAAVRGAALLKFHDPQTPKTPVHDEEADLHSQGPFHRSRYGLCRRSWRAGPCNRFADCLNCSELLMCKGDKLAVDTIEKDRDYLHRTYTAAQQAIKDGERSVSRWTSVAGPQIERLDQLLFVLKDNRIPEGSPIEMAGTDFSHESTVLEGKAAETGIKLLDRNSLTIEYGSELISCLDQLSSNDNA